MSAKHLEALSKPYGFLVSTIISMHCISTTVLSSLYALSNDDQGNGWGYDYGSGCIRGSNGISDILTL